MIFINLLVFLFPNLLALPAIAYSFSRNALKISINESNYVSFYLVLISLVILLIFKIFTGLFAELTFELKIVFFAIFSWIAYHSHYRGNNHVGVTSPNFVIIGSIAIIIINIVSGLSIFRYSDVFPFREGLISGYLGVIIGLFLFSHYQLTRIQIASLIMLFLLNGAATALIAATSVLILKQLRSFTLGRFVMTGIVVILMAGVFLVSIELRGRDLSDLESIDRFQLLQAYFTWYGSFGDFYTFLWGFPLDGRLASFFSYITIDNIYEYAFSEFGLTTSARLLHNDILRTFHNFGLTGLLFLVWIFHKTLPLNLEQKLFLLVASLGNSVLYASVIFFIIIQFREGNEIK